MRKKPRHETKTTEFELEDIEEAYAPSPGTLWKPQDFPKLEVETPPELRVAIEHIAKAWIVERRERGPAAAVKRWLRGVFKR